MSELCLPPPLTAATRCSATPEREREPEDDWRLLLAGDDPFAGVEVLFDRHRHYVYRLACGVLADRTLAEDATQEVFLRMARGRRRWTPRARFRTWLYKLTVNTCRELGRRRREAAIPDGFDRGSELGARDLLPDLGPALARLSRRQREVVVLRHLEGLSTGETAAVLGCREGTVKVHLHRALRALKAGLAGGPPDGGGRSPTTTRSDLGGAGSSIGARGPSTGKAGLDEQDA